MLRMPLVQEKNRLRHLRNNAEGKERDHLHQEYKSYRRMVKQMFKEERDRYRSEVLGRIMTLKGTAKWKDYWSELKDFVGLRKGKLKFPQTLMDKNVRYEGTEVLTARRLAFKEISRNRLHNGSFGFRKDVKYDTMIPVLDAPISKAEVVLALLKLQRVKQDQMVCLRIC